MARLQVRLGALQLVGIKRAPTFSAGLCCAGPTCFLTDREILERANRAKDEAKARGKNRIATYTGELFRDQDLVVGETPRDLE